MKLFIKLISFFLFTFALFLGNLSAQEKKLSFLEKKDQNCFEIEALTFSYAYAHKYHPRLTLGMRIQFGFGLRFLLTNPSFYRGCDQCPPGSSPVWDNVRAYGGGTYADALKLQFFYRLNPSKHSYFDFGPYITVGFMPEMMNGGITAGLEGSAFYTISNFHIGTRLMAGWQFFLAKNFNSNYFGLYSSPLVIGINF